MAESVTADVDAFLRTEIDRLNTALDRAGVPRVVVPAANER
jgi:hypothetical protein